MSKDRMRSVKASLIAGAMLLSAMPSVPGYAINASADENAYMMNENFEGSNSWEGRGGAAVEVSSKNSYSGSSALYCSGRTASWNGAQITLDSSVYKSGSTYSFSVETGFFEGRSKTNKMMLSLQYTGADGDPVYAHIAQANAVRGRYVQLANTAFTIPEAAVDPILYVEMEKDSENFYVDDVIIAAEGTTVDGPAEAFLNPGDINFSGRVDVFDNILARRGLINGFSDGASNLAADVNEDGEYKIDDLVQISSYVLGRKDEFEVYIPPKKEFIYDSNLQYKPAPENDQVNYFRQPAEHGQVIKENYDGICGNKNMYVYVPYGYDPSQKYNVFYLMHGGGESEETCFNDDAINIDIMLDNMIANGDIEPMIVVTPTFNKCASADAVWEEMRKSIIPYVEAKYSTYADGDVSLSSLQASRYHRAYGGFSMGGGSTWANFNHNLDIIAYFMPLSGHCWDGANAVCNAARQSGFAKNEYFVLAATGTKDLAYENMVPMINDLKKNTDVFTYTSDFSQGNLYFLEAPGNVHWWPQVRHYIYDALPYFFHEGT
ncbi:MAG: carbohydrate binding domain-containing protein [Ruminococcus sp.]|nr:carbohydrate binding domain-containing protein [Ruminococcus sp.]